MYTPKWALERIQEAKDQSAKRLDLGGFAQNERLSEIPLSVFQLQELTEIDLSFNNINFIPGEIINLKNLNNLSLRGNSINEFPEILLQIKNLKSLNLANNYLAKMPEDISSLQNLEILVLTSNKLKHLPKSTLRLAKLINLQLSDNPLITPPLEIASRGIIPIREYFRQLQVGQDYLYEAKLLILGEGGAGKTTLAKKIINPNYKLKEEQTTEGIDVLRWSYRLENGKYFHVNIWDFGGQEIYHTTHQFFLTKRSLYTLVADTRKEDTDFYYWLNVVELLSNNSPVLIMKNEKQNRKREINERQLRGQFENLKEVLSANLATNRGLDQVVLEIKHYLRSLPHIGSPLPKTWVSVREELEKDSRNYISIDEYLFICKENGFEKTEDSLQLSGYLHDIGVFLHFQDDPLLKKTVILKPKWGTYAVYQVLDNKDILYKLGRFTRLDLNKIWGAPEYKDMTDELLQLMMKFKLCYQIPNSDGTYIAPQLLTENQLDYNWEENENLLLRYTYEFMPKGILTQFIVSMHPYILEQNYVWKSGVILFKDKTKAEVIEHYGKREIRIRIVGPHKKEFLAIITHELDKIHSNFKKLKHNKLIPCNCKECKYNQDPYFYRFEHLQNFTEKGIARIQCGKSGEMVNVHNLIDDVFEKEFVHEERGAPMAQYVIHGDYIDQGDKKMTDNKISINNSTIHGSVVAAESIKDSFNVINKADIKDDLKEQLKQLTQAVETMIKELPKEKAEEVAEDMKVLAEQATKEKPNPKWYNVSVDGLTKAAENLGKVGEPVINLVGKILKSLATG